MSTPTSVRSTVITAALSLAACGGGQQTEADGDDDVGISIGDTTSADMGDGDGDSGDGDGDPGDGDGDPGDGDGGPIKFDMTIPDADDTGGFVDECKVSDNMNAVGECEESAPPDSFEPDIQWTFGANEKSWVTPLVGNFTDDNEDGEIDLCDIPDAILVSNTSISYNTDCYVHFLDGETGVEHFNIPPSEHVSCVATPAFGDIDNDGLPELVTVWNSPGGVFRLKAFEHDGTVKWINQIDGAAANQFYRQSGAIAIHDLDADGNPEIIFNHEVYDSDGVLLWEHINPAPGELEASVGVDLDGDGLMEVVTGHSAYHFDGTVYFENYPTITGQSIPQIGNLDDDPEPEIFVTSGSGLFLVEHDGTIKWGPVTPTGVAAGAYLVWQRPGTIHDFDGDGIAEMASSSRQFYAVYQGPQNADVLWQAMVSDNSGAAGGTAFDFLGDGVAEAMYADEQFMRIYDGQTGAVLLQQARGSATISEYPTVADVDNDGSAEILVVSMSAQPALQVIRDVEDRWIQARRIWNQHAYYVTNVREDGTIPTQPINNWETLNTYRTNAQIEGGGLCLPDPQG
ncbi:FG-GAP repeat domain-containing protein [Enhygromyxa salina]|uniref:FG-GAP repeat protein n=1 Tax=Enhygromyxa salina TaxID=215803 RepID=A0A2S9Y0F9_9BACT|nr:VCBS repeat-containing protein [Enhygromyxa salina]PRP98602.1 FG-GAP repeat protein [Enhygromyxa salina]